MNTHFLFRMIFAACCFFGFLACSNTQSPAMTQFHSDEQIAQILTTFSIPVLPNL